MGWTGFKFVTHETNHHNNFYDLGYRILKRFWGQGIATESAMGSIAYAFEKLNIHEVYAMANYENDGSNKILKKIGLRFMETFDLDCVKHNWYKIDKQNFESKKLNR